MDTGTRELALREAMRCSLAAMHELVNALDELSKENTSLRQQLEEAKSRRLQ